MKMYFLRIPENGGAALAKFCFENEMKIALSYAVDAFINGVQICAYVVMSEGDKEKLFVAQYKTAKAV